MKTPMLTSSKARTFAETLWGRGGTSTERTNRKGCFYFSCSGHGGYIVDADSLTKEEQDAVWEYMNPESCLVMTRGDKITFWQNPFSYKNQKYRIYSDSVQHNKQVFVFEEDCDWAILEKLTSVRTKQTHIPEEKLSEIRDRTFYRYAKSSTELQMAQQL